MTEQSAELAPQPPAPDASMPIPAMMAPVVETPPPHVIPPAPVILPAPVGPQALTVAYNGKLFMQIPAERDGIMIDWKIVTAMARAAQAAPMLDIDHILALALYLVREQFR